MSACLDGRDQESIHDIFAVVKGRESADGRCSVVLLALDTLGRFGRVEKFG